MNLPFFPSDLVGWISALIAIAVGVVMGIQRVTKQWAASSRDIEKLQGEIDVVSLLRTELGRMRIQNDTLATLVNKLQTQLIEMTGKNARMKQQLETLEFDLNSMRGPQGLNP